MTSRPKQQRNVTFWHRDRQVFHDTFDCWRGYEPYDCKCEDTGIDHYRIVRGVAKPCAELSRASYSYGEHSALAALFAKIHRQGRGVQCRRS